MENDDNKCSVIHSAGTGMSLREWWPGRLDLSILRQNSVESNPYGPNFDYTEEFSRLDMNNVNHCMNY
jgi:catalase-peroxidase